MIEFKPSKILSDSELIAQELQRARQEKKLDIKEVAKKINISLKYLEALESGEFEKLPAGTYGKNFLKEYAIFLKLDYKNLIQIFEKDYFEKHNQERKKKLFSKQVIKSHNFLIVPKILKNILIILVVIICLSYLGYRLKQAVYPPILNIIAPIDNLVTNKKTVNIIGETDSEAQVIINGEVVVKNSNGMFTKNINLRDGVNTIVIISKKNMGKRER